MAATKALRHHTKSDTITPLNLKVRAIAFYLPQFHPIPENDEWWGKGFTEWTNVVAAKPLFAGHQQPQLPSDLGFYDLRLPEVREAQAALARDHGIEGFCYWHYWLGGRRLLERPFDEVLATGKPDFPFCLGWANHDWTGLWASNSNNRLLKQPYPGEEDEKRHFEFLCRAFMDHRYIRVEGKPLLVIYQPLEIPNSASVFARWRSWALSAGFPGLHIVATLHNSDSHTNVAKLGYDAITIWPIDRILNSAPSFLRARIKRWVTRRTENPLWRGLVERLWRGSWAVYDYGQLLPNLISHEEFQTPYYPMAIPNWDTTPRYKGGPRNIVVLRSTPERFRQHLREACQRAEKNSPTQQIVFIKSWNEWAEGNYLEPSARFGRAYLEAVRGELCRNNSCNAPLPLQPPAVV